MRCPLDLRIYGLDNIYTFTYVDHGQDFSLRKLAIGSLQLESSRISREVDYG